MTTPDKLMEILNKFYKHATGVDDFGCKYCLEANSAITKLFEDDYITREFHEAHLKEQKEGWKKFYEERMLTEEGLTGTILKSLDNIGLELRVWKEDYFGSTAEAELAKQLAHAIHQAQKTKLEGK